jgi:hypothetical protein
MKKNTILLALIVSLAGLAGCTPTLLSVRSEPPGANAMLERAGVQTKTDDELEVPEQFFAGDVDRRGDVLRVTKAGYREARIPLTLEKGKEHDLPPRNDRQATVRGGVIILDAIDTSLRVDSNPRGVAVWLGLSDVSPADAQEELEALGWRTQFTTPAQFKCTAKEAKALHGRLVLMGAELEGYRPTGPFRALSNGPVPVELDPGQSNALTLPMQPLITTVRVETSPPGVIVEDISDGGFGYLGETPLVRNFNWEEVQQWAARQTVSRGGQLVERDDGKVVTVGASDIDFEAINLTLRLSKAGHRDVFLRGLRIPIGEERAYRKDLKEELHQIHFASEPEGVHVYVEREADREVYDEATHTLSLKKVTYKKHLGATPFTLNVDPSDPLRHGETLLFEKTGYRSARIPFAAGNDAYHQVLTPERIRER